ncbi:MAG: ATP-binding cassette domain-containing protein [Deltaproteobacteria bacterium]|nr:ATP-binding cassette domain-containing protein [Deltaproteobacteria bacterium]
MKGSFREVFLLLLLETAFFGVVLLFLLAEGIITILAVILGTIVVSFIIVREPSVSAFFQGLFTSKRKIALAWGVVFILGLPFLLHKSPYLIHILFMAGLYAALAIGLDFQVGSTHLVNFATAADYGIGAYTAALLSVKFGWSFWVVLPLGGVAAALFGFLLGLPTMKTKTYYLSLVTIAVGLIIYLLLNNFSWTGGPNGVSSLSEHRKIFFWVFASHIWDRTSIPGQFLLPGSAAPFPRVYRGTEIVQFNPPEADEGLIPRPLGRLRWFPTDTPLLAAGKFILVRPRTGQILFSNMRIDKLKTHQIVKMGISVVPEGRQLFPKLTVAESLRIGAYLENNNRVIRERMEKVFQVFPILRERINQVAGTLSGGELGILSIARSLMSEPKMMILDEPSLGLAPKITSRVFKAIKDINEKGITILLIEQNAKKSLRISNYGYILQKGQIVARGDVETIRQSDTVKKAYLSHVS